MSLIRRAHGHPSVGRRTYKPGQRVYSGFFCKTMNLEKEMNSVARQVKLRRRPLAALIFTSTLALAGNVFSAETTTTMDVSLVITAGCGISASEMVFPEPTAVAPLHAIAQIDITCSNGTPFQIGLDAGAHSADVAARQMQDAGSLETITYSIYQSGAHTVVWGNTQGVNTVASTGDGFVQQFSAYGQVPVPAVFPSAGTYTDTVNAFVYF